MGESELELGLKRQFDGDELDDILSGQGFSIARIETPRQTVLFDEYGKENVIPISPPDLRIRRRVYFFHDKESKSKPFVRFEYQDGLYTDTHWGEIDSLVVAQGNIVIGSDVNTNNVCRNKQKNVAKFFKEHYDAIIYYTKEDDAIIYYPKEDDVTNL